MARVFEISKSNKSGLNSKESYIVTRNKVSYLRILGAEPQWGLMTATADEDNKRIKVCPEQLRLVETALRLGNELTTSPLVEKDWAGREYVQICLIHQPPEQSDQELTHELSLVLHRFFELYDAWTVFSSRSDDDMVALYDAVAPDNAGSDVYLSDGIWLSRDGTLTDRGR
ncbi:hypothetical protein [Citrobacter sp. JGM124]|uniref:hypothetical protein n=1 Tax=Citrobacter sp. JGM124 TaxID=2799789 RepID=UPI001BA711E7|nr:hypothetical protein [Citrobacter sp. JGM124]MBS0846971.1 hypothetical protein [Citrobacter sp. JGM124]